MAKYQKNNRRNLSDAELNKKREKSKEAMRKLRGRIKSNLAKYEDSKRKDGERYNARKAAGRIKSVKDMTPREQRRMRKVWRVKFNNRYKKKKDSRQLEMFLDEHTPPNSPDVPDRFEEENVIQDVKCAQGNTRRGIKDNKQQRMIMKKDLKSKKNGKF
nr:unnamed protein product [Callosobruchus analis]